MDANPFSLAGRDCGGGVRDCRRRVPAVLGANPIRNRVGGDGFDAGLRGDNVRSSLGYSCFEWTGCVACAIDQSNLAGANAFDGARH
jgi:hypothetical protein